MPPLTLIPREEFSRIRITPMDRYLRLQLLADMCRANCLSLVKRAGSGHLGSSLSAMDIVVWLYYEEMNTITVGLESQERDIYFSSKGHDVPGLYAVLYSLGLLPEEKLLKLRRFNGLDGHPDIGTPGVEANSGSLGMGISKGRGLAWGKEFLGHGGRVFVTTGDGEFQEGQIYEGLQTTVQQRVTNLIVILDHNKVQTDKPVSEIIDLGNLDEKLRSFGWYVARGDGHDFRQLERVFSDFRQRVDKPKIFIADTIKGRGVSFMEHPVALKTGKGLYPWHAGAPDDHSFQTGYQEIVDRINAELQHLTMAPLTLKPVPLETKPSSPTYSLEGEQLSFARASQFSKVSDEYVVNAYGEALLDLAQKRSDLVVLDADLAADCRVRKFDLAYPKRFIENGIAEQDMVSMAGGLARQGLLPVVNSFASFLASRANEQIYNNASEKTKIIYACHYAGLIPAGPGKSHQSLRDISLFGALPNVTIVQPCNAKETRMLVDYCVNQAEENCVLRLIIGPSPRLILLPPDYTLTPGKGVVLRDGRDAVIFAYGPVMLHEVLLASEILQTQDLGLRVVNMPWLNRIDAAWLAATIQDSAQLFVVEDHAPVGGLGDRLLEVLAVNGILNGRSLTKFAVEGYPVCGTPQQALQFHQLDGPSLASRVMQKLRS